MKNLKLFFLTAFVLITANASFAQSRVTGRVIEIVDGKTIVIELLNGGLLTAELQYIEIPERGQPFREVAREHLQNLTLGKKVDFKARGLMPTRTVGQLFLQGVDVSQQMIRDGAAWYAILEKSGQNPDDSKIYQSNEASAKSEKRGIWSIENLKPSWEIRAEAETNRKQKEEPAQKEFQKAYAQPAPKRRVVAPRPANTDFQMWADVSSYAAEEAGGAGGLVTQYNASSKIGYVATSRGLVDLAAQKANQKVDFRMAYAYRDSEKGRESGYLIGALSESESWKFLKSNSLTIVADNQKIVLGNAYRLYRHTPDAVQELLLYKIKRSDLAKIARAKNAQIKIGAYSGNLSDKLQSMIKNLFQAAE